MSSSDFGAWSEGLASSLETLEGFVSSRSEADGADAASTDVAPSPTVISRSAMCPSPQQRGKGRPESPTGNRAFTQNTILHEQARRGKRQSQPYLVQPNRSIHLTCILRLGQA